MSDITSGYRVLTSLVLTLGLTSAAIAASHDQAGEVDGPWSNISAAIATIHPTTEGDAEGQVRFEKNNDGSVTMSADIRGLDPESQHGFHIHEYGDCSHDKAESAGDHYNPENHPHGLPSQDQPRHVGDFGNLTADNQGRAQLVKTVDKLTLSGHHNPILGRSILVHADADDGSQPSGNAGSRIGCGVIGIAAE